MEIQICKFVYEHYSKVIAYMELKVSYRLTAHFKLGL